MSYKENRGASAQIGIAYSSYVPSFVSKHPDTVDYIELPFEVLHFQNDSAAAILDSKPIILHCASLSMAGSLPPAWEITKSVQHWIHETKTPWLGEHLAYITAARPTVGQDNLEPLSSLYDTGYSVGPPMNTETLEYVLHSVQRCEDSFGVPILLENSPVYFTPPGSTMTQVEFVNEICACSSARLLLDLAHFYITSRVLKFNPLREVLRFPLERVDEIHISGVDFQDESHWDDHTRPAPDVVFDLLATVLAHCRPRAVTLEYNWSVRFPEDLLLGEIARARQVLAATCLPST
jgi:uncharacterized protein (UPF0276 family)